LRILSPKLAFKQTDDDLKLRFGTLNSLSDLSLLLEVPAKTLTYYAYKNRAYTTFSIPKRRGGTRTISAPANKLKIVQQKLNHVFRLIYRTRNVVHGFALGRSIVTNSAAHTKNRYILNVDLKDFFTAVTFRRVRATLMAQPYSVGPTAATTIAQLCTANGSLPQGAPTSPILTNMVCGRMDSHLKKLARTYRCNYTRYADDITFSTSLRSFPFALAETVAATTKVVVGAELLHAITTNGFEVNPDKVRLQEWRQRQEVTGLVSNKFPNVARSYIRQLRAIMHAWNKFGADNTAKEFFSKHYYKGNSGDADKLRRVVRGRIEFVGQVRGKDDPIFRRLLLDFGILNPEYGIEVGDDIDTDFRIIRTALWVYESDSTQGTAFMLEQFGLVTCAHVLGEQHYVYNAVDPSKKYPASVVRQDIELDLALLQLQGGVSKSKQLKIGESNRLKTQDPITLLGFPEHHKGDEGVVVRGQVTGRRTRLGQERILISPAIVSGSSGGPVLDSRNRVIGVAATGADKFENINKTVDYGVIPIEALLSLL
jgi:RNA-directed DNA polymerase